MHKQNGKFEEKITTTKKKNLPRHPRIKKYNNLTNSIEFLF